MTGLRFYFGSRSITSGGTISEGLVSTTWTFTEENPLIGVFGDYSGGKINKIGFISLDTLC